MLRGLGAPFYKPKRTRPQGKCYSVICLCASKWLRCLHALYRPRAAIRCPNASEYAACFRLQTIWAWSIRKPVSTGWELMRSMPCRDSVQVSCNETYRESRSCFILPSSMQPRFVILHSRGEAESPHKISYKGWPHHDAVVICSDLPSQKSGLRLLLLSPLHSFEQYG